MSDWVHGGLLYGILLLLCTPVPGRDWPSSILTIFLRFMGNLLHRYRKDDDSRLGVLVSPQRNIGWLFSFSLPVTEQGSTRPAAERYRRAHPRGSILA
jgi:hypothetical protein